MVSDVFPEHIKAKLLLSSMMIRGLSSEMKSVHPECAILYPEVQNDIGNTINDNVMLENCNDVDFFKEIGLKQEDSGNDAKSNINTYVYKR